MTDKLLTYSGPRALLERATQSLNGIRVWFATRAEAQACLNRISTVKTNMRKRDPLDPQLASFDSTISRIAPADFKDVLEIAKAQSDLKLEQDLVLPDDLPGGWWLYLSPYDAGANGYLVEEL